MNQHDAAVFSAEAGCFISEKMERLARIIKEYDPYLELKWIPPGARNGADTLPYAVMASHPIRDPYVLFRFGELEEPENVLARIFLGDNSRNDVLKAIEAQEAAKKAFDLRAELDERMEMHDQFHFLLTNRSNNWVKWKVPETGEIVKLDSNRRRIG